MIKNRRAWIKIVEAFIAVLLIAGALLFVINQGYIGKRDISAQVYDAQLSVLREIELNSSLRLQILGVTLDPNGHGDSPTQVQDKIDLRMPEYLDCVSRVCNLSSACPFPSTQEYPVEKDIYTQAVPIAAEGTLYGPRQLKMFCWTAG